VCRGARQAAGDLANLHGAHVVPLAGQLPRLVHIPPAVVGGVLRTGTPLTFNHFLHLRASI